MRKSAYNPWSLLVFFVCLAATNWSTGCKHTSLFTRKNAPPPPIESVPDALSAIRASSDPSVRRDAFEFLGEPRHYSGNDASRDEITEILKLALTSEAANDKDPAVRVTVCRVLGQAGATQATPQLDDLLMADSSLDVRLAAADALGNLPSRQAALALLEGIDDPDVALRFRCRESLKKLTGSDHSTDLAGWRQEIQTASFEQPAGRRRLFGLR
ncbi:MAG: HEAT repeat domain-containing protein [Planctomycetes bacterium]|nr:HEAT repeat domain-containing protein [Planctomycetota bacterium]